ncbi:MAG: histidine phosphatase family protein [Paludibacterium sp.]|uniref:histidine phosphatase family protein n=1 Tax=Paludibacterium sp. TaxID=1917523 RepID=UPI0025F90E54|nr:histidine phosphatase family protein [Paludibacterium sp.]MBV8049051.1 histidine phosphatase family protein [Paludibacterium sp.]MBV8649634.1 histidine phosphatase family protein [Paludibacterium sp.]
MNPYTLTLLRHGDIDHQGRLAGRREVPLTPEGSAMMDRSWHQIAALAPVSSMATSPLTRCREFAVRHALAAAVPLKVDERFAEVDLGDWDGREQAALAAAEPRWEQAWQAGQLSLFGGESPEVFHTRVLSGFSEWIAASRGCHRVLVTHGPVITALLTELLDMAPAAASLITIQPGGFVQLSILQGHPAYLMRLDAPPPDAK